MYNFNDDASDASVHCHVLLKLAISVVFMALSGTRMIGIQFLYYKLHTFEFKITQKLV